MNAPEINETDVYITIKDKIQQNIISSYHFWTIMSWKKVKNI